MRCSARISIFHREIHIADFPFDGTTVSVARTGYTGEDGIEVFFRATDAVKFWNAALEKGKQFGIKPCGLGARDTLRLEMCYPLNGSDLSPERNPIEAGLGFFVDLYKTKLHRAQGFVEHKTRRTARKARAVSNERERTAAATALRSLRER